MKSDVSLDNNRLTIKRVLRAPRPAVFAWWKTAEKYRQWSGCKEATQCEVVMDFKVGGSFTQKMQLAVNGGTCEFSVTGVYQEIVEPERIRYRANLGAAPVDVTVEFFERGEATEVVVTYEGFPDESIGRNVSRGTSESFDKLGLLINDRTMIAATPCG